MPGVVTGVGPKLPAGGPNIPGAVPNVEPRLICCLSFFVRPMKKQRAKARVRAAAPATAMPTIAPVDRPWCDEDETVAAPCVDVAVDVAVEAKEAIDDDASAGKGSPGCNMNCDVFASVRCICRDTDAFYPESALSLSFVVIGLALQVLTGLMTPTME